MTGTFPITFFEDLSFSHSEIILLFTKCYTFEMFFSAIMISSEKSHFKLSNNEPLCMCKESWCVRLGQEGELSA